MNYIEEIFERCSIDKISSFILHGAEHYSKEDEDYSTRVKNAYSRLDKWLEEFFPKFDEPDKEASFLFGIMSEIESVFMEIGLEAGILLAADFKNKTRNMR